MVGICGVMLNGYTSTHMLPAALPQLLAVCQASGADNPVSAAAVLLAGCQAAWWLEC